jgi:hypothetical protein
MAYLRTVRRGKRTYYYVVKSVRSSATVRQKILQYLGEPDAATLKRACEYWGVKAKRRQRRKGRAGR